MASGTLPLFLAPEAPEDEETVVVSEKKLDRWLKEQQEEERLTEEIERLRGEAKELRRRLSVHESPNVPPSVRNHSPGYDRVRTLVPPEARKKPGPKAGHPGSTREPLVSDLRVTLAADQCGRCRSVRLE
jgi:hypothetical protein